MLNFFTINLSYHKLWTLKINFKLIRYFPDRSLFGYKVLNSWNSILLAYFFIGLQLIITPLFGVSFNQLIAGSFFILLINISILILTLNALLRNKKKTFFWLLSMFLLFINVAFSLKNIIFEISYLKTLIT